MTRFDVVVIGAGTVGLSAAISLARRNFKILLLESLEQSKYLQPVRVGRLYAISSGSQKIFLKHCALRKNIHSSQKIRAISVYDLSSSAMLSFSPEDIGEHDFGVMIDEFDLNNELFKKASALPNITCLYGVEVNAVNSDSGEVATNHGDFKAETIIVADGKHSKTKAYLGVEDRKHDFEQVACVFDISYERDHKGIAYEIFTPQGPIAALPKHGGKASGVVWTIPKKFAPVIAGLDNKTFLALVQERLDHALGEVSITCEKAIFNLTSVSSREYHKGRVVFVGDSLHAIHPMAGQGLNLSMRDLDYVVDKLVSCKELGLDPYFSHAFENYAADRMLDNETMSKGMILLDDIMSSYSPILSALRGVGIDAIDAMPVFKNVFMKYAANA